MYRPAVFPIALQQRLEYSAAQDDEVQMSWFSFKATVPTLLAITALGAFMGCEAGTVRLTDSAGGADVSSGFSDVLPRADGQGTDAIDDAELFEIDGTGDSEADPETNAEETADSMGEAEPAEIADGGDSEELPEPDATETVELIEIAEALDSTETSETNEISTDTPSDTLVACEGDGDGIITASELGILVDAVISYRVNASETVVDIPDLAGEPCEQGLCWDLSGDNEADEVVADSVNGIADYWFADRFPTDAYVIPLDARTGSLGVYRKTDDALELLGMASEAEGETALAYDPPVALLAFPLQKGAAWDVTAEAVGLFEGDSYPNAFGVQIRHTYAFLVNGAGRIQVPAGSWDVLRLLLDLRMEVGTLFGPPLAIERFKVYDFLAECVGLVARVRSTEGELDSFFDQATEYKRLGF
jgi:hypothetical protein